MSDRREPYTYVSLDPLAPGCSQRCPDVNSCSIAPPLACVQVTAPNHASEEDDVAGFVLEALPPTPARVLEVGCGRGDLAKQIAVAGYAVLAVDPDAPEGPLFRRTKLEDLEEAGRFNAAVARYSLHHVEDLDLALERLVSLLEPPGILVIEEFGWDRFDRATARWYGQQQGEVLVESVLAEWRGEHEGLHGYAAMRRALDERFNQDFFEERPYLYRCLERDDLELSEREAIMQGAIRPIGFRYVGTPR